MEKLPANLTEEELTLMALDIFNKPCSVVLYPHYFIISVGVSEDNDACDGNIEVFSNGTMEVSSYNFQVPFVLLSQWGEHRGLW